MPQLVHKSSEHKLSMSTRKQSTYFFPRFVVLIVIVCMLGAMNHPCDRTGEKEFN